MNQMTRQQESNLAEFDELDLDALGDMDKEVDAAGGSEFMKLEVGQNVVRFLPPQRGEKLPFKIIHEHFLENVPGQDNKTVRIVCPRKMSQGKLRCPVCESGDMLKRSTNQVDRNDAKKMYPTMRIYANVIDRNAPETGPKIMTFGKMIWKQLKNILNDKQNGGNFTEPGPNGFDIVITREGTGKNDTRYDVKPARNDSPLGNNEWLEKRWPLDEYAVIPDSGDVLSIMRGEEPTRASRRQALPSGEQMDKDVATARQGRGRGRTAQQDVEVLPPLDEDDVPY
jgi:hypothetical protein